MKQAEKGIRFITPHYEEKFRIADGDMIRIRCPDGHQLLAGAALCRKGRGAVAVKAPLKHHDGPLLRHLAVAYRWQGMPGEGRAH